METTRRGTPLGLSPPSSLFGIFELERARESRNQGRLKLLRDGCRPNEVETVKRPGDNVQLRRYARVDEPARIVDVFVDEEINRTDADEGWRQTAQVSDPGRHGAIRHARRAGRNAQQRRPSEAVGFRSPDDGSQVRRGLSSAARPILQQ